MIWSTLYIYVTVTRVTPTSAVGITRAGAYGVHVYTYTACTSRKCGLTLHVQRPGYPYRRVHIQYIQYIQYTSRGAALSLHLGCIFSCPWPLVNPTDFGRVNPPARGLNTVVDVYKLIYLSLYLSIYLSICLCIYQLLQIRCK